MLKIIKTTKKSRCEGSCCTGEESKKRHMSIKETLVDDVVKKSECACIRSKCECSEDCGCDPETCWNMQMTKK